MQYLGRKESTYLISEIFIYSLDQILKGHIICAVCADDYCWNFSLTLEDGKLAISMFNWKRQVENQGVGKEGRKTENEKEKERR